MAWQGRGSSDRYIVAVAVWLWHKISKYIKRLCSLDAFKLNRRHLRYAMLSGVHGYAPKSELYINLYIIY